MSRKWERMVEKNRKQLNRLRQKQGKPAITEDGQSERFMGRSVVLPLFLLSVAAVFTYSTVRFSEADGLFWFTVISYILLSLYFFFLKRPYLRIGSSEVATRKWGRERVAKFSDLEKIRVQPGTVSIVVRGEKSEWVFSRSLNLFKTDRMAERLEQLAKKHRVPFERSLKVR